MKKHLLWALLLSFCTFNVTSAQAYHLVDYKPLSKDECIKYREKIGIEFCPHNNDHLAGAALACGHIDNLPSPDELLILARRVYNSENKQWVRGARNDQLMKDLNIWVNERHIFYWSNKEDKKVGIVRLFDLQRSKSFPALRDGSGYYVSGKPVHISDVFDVNSNKDLKKNKLRFKLTPYPPSVSSKDTTLTHSNYDALVAICTKSDADSIVDDISDDENEPSFKGIKYNRFCALLCGKGAEYRRRQGSSVRVCLQPPTQNNGFGCVERSGTYQGVQYICECPE